MILDSSAILAIIFEEVRYQRLVDAMFEAGYVGAGTPTVVETGIVLTHRRPKPGRMLLERFLDEGEVDEIPFTDVHWRVAIDAHEKYGKGRHPARLNFGDCLTYATARVAGDTLLFVGDDFSKTDIPAAV